MAASLRTSCSDLRALVDPSGANSRARWNLSPLRSSTEGQLGLPSTVFGLIDFSTILMATSYSPCREVWASGPYVLSGALAGVTKVKTKAREIGIRERPVELIYALDEIPPWPHLLGLGFQHVAVICPYLVMVALVAEAAKLPHSAAQSAISLAMIAVAFMTVLQSLRLGAVGSGYLCPPVVTAIYLPSSLAAAASLGISAVCGMVIFAGACEIAVASLVNRTRKLFPAVVSGVVIYGRRIGARKDRRERVVAAYRYAQRSNRRIFRDRRLHACGDGGPCGLGHGLAETLLLADRDSGGIRRRGDLRRFSTQLLRGLQGGEPIRCARPELSILCVRSLFRRGFRDRGTRLGSPSDRRADDLPADERCRVATPRCTQHRGRTGSVA